MKRWRDDGPRVGWFVRPARVACFALALSCGQGPASAGPIDGTWQLEPSRSRYGVNAEPRITEVFDCRTRERTLRCDIISVRQSGDTTRARFAAGPDGTGRVSGIAGVDRVRVERVKSALTAVFADGESPLLGYRLEAYGDSLVVQTTDPFTGETLDTRVVYTRVRGEPGDVR
jgi:hypothetical protein